MLKHSFKVHHSGIFATLLLLVYTVAIFIVSLLPLDTLLKIVFTALLLGTLFYYLYLDVWLLSSSSYVAIRIEGDDVVLITKDGNEVAGRVSRNSMVMPIITVLNVFLTEKERMCSIVIFPDSMDSIQFRELRVFLKWGALLHNGGPPDL